jgi:predicted nucleic acid-binding protein
MICAIDSSVLVAAMNQAQSSHQACLQILTKSEDENHAYHHALLETFSSLTGGRLGFRACADAVAARLQEMKSDLTVIHLDTDEILTGLANARKHGVRGGAVYDYMHLVAARKAKAEVLYTLNVSDFEALHRDGDPKIVRP